MNGPTDHSDDTHIPTTVYRKIQPKATAYEVTKDADAHLASLIKDKATDGATFCNGTDKTNSDSSDSALPTTVRFTDAQTDPTLGTTAAPSTALGSLLVVSPLPNCVNKNPKLVVLNGNVLKDVSAPEKGKNDLNIIYLANNLGNIIKKLNYDATVKAAPKTDAAEDGEKTERAPTSVPTYVQLSQSNLKTLSSKLTINVNPSAGVGAGTPAKPAKTAGLNILRKKLENGPTTTTGESSLAQSMRKIVDKNRRIFKKDQAGDSPAVASARNELIESRRSLIQVAMRKQMPIYKPPADYTGPTFSCEECYDT